MLFQDTNDDRRDLTLFEDAIHQTAKLTSDSDEVKVLLKQTYNLFLFSLPPLIIDEAK